MNKNNNMDTKVSSSDIYIPNDISIQREKSESHLFYQQLVDHWIMFCGLFLGMIGSYMIYYQNSYTGAGLLSIGMLLGYKPLLQSLI